MNKPGRWFVLAAVAGLLLGWWLAPVANAAAPPREPIAVIRSTADRVMEILNTTQPSASAEDRQKRRDEIVKIVYEFVNFQEMSQRALGRHWAAQPEDKRKAFVPLFEKLLYNTYIDKVDNYSTGTERAVFDNQVLQGDYALVRGRIVGYQNKDVAVDYRLKLQNGRWMAYDVVIEGVSFISNYRSQFNSILANNNFDALLDQMRQKITELEKKTQ